MKIISSKITLLWLESREPPEWQTGGSVGVFLADTVTITVSTPTVVELLVEMATRVLLVSLSGSLVTLDSVVVSELGRLKVTIRLEIQCR